MGLSLHVALRAVSVSLLTAATLCAQAKPAADVGIVEGRVLGPLGEPMVNLEVRASAWPELDTILAKTRTDGEGMFVLSRLPLRTLRLGASSPGLTAARATAWLSTEDPHAAVQVRLWPANTLRGRVLDGDGKPVAGAVVLGTRDYVWYETGFDSPEMQTAADGRFEVAGVPIGDCMLRAWAPGYVMREHGLLAIADREIELRLDRGEGSVLALRTVGLPPEARARSRVSYYPTRSGYGFVLPRQFESGALDAQGCWRVSGLPSAEWHVELTADGFTFDPRSVATKMDEPQRELVFTATAIGSLQLRGVLRSADGKPLAGERLVCRTKKSQSINGGTPGEATTDAEGRFVMNAPLVAGEPYSLHLVASQWVLEQKKSEGMMGVWDSRYLVRYEDQADGARELALVAQPAVFVSARLVGDDNRPVAFARAELQQRTDGRSPAYVAMNYAISRRDGTVAFPGINVVADDLRVWTGGGAGAGASDMFHVQRGERRELVVRVQRPGTVSGCVRDENGKPVPGYCIAISSHDLGTGRPIDGVYGSVPAGRDGRFVFVGVAPGGHKLTSDRREQRACSSDVFEVSPGATVNVELQLKK